jgi:hypothetical protein
MEAQIKIFRLLLLLLWAPSSIMFGQRNLLNEEIQRAKNDNVEFKNISAFKEASKDRDILEYFIDTNAVHFFDFVPIKFAQEKAIRLSLPVNPQKPLVLELLEVPESFYDYEVKTSSGKTYKADRSIKHYRGIVKNVPNSFVTITVFNGEVVGVIATNEGQLTISPNSRTGKHLLFNEDNLKEKIPFVCETTDKDLQKEVVHCLLFPVMEVQL